MATCVPIRDLRDTAAFAKLVKESPEDITVTRNGYDEFVCVRSDEYRRLKHADARANLMTRIAIAERERAQGAGAFAEDAQDFGAGLGYIAQGAVRNARKKGEEAMKGAAKPAEEEAADELAAKIDAIREKIIANATEGA